jgi:hypothetical protein
VDFCDYVKLHISVRSVAIRHLNKRQVRTGALREYQEISMILYYLGDNSAILCKDFIVSR